MTNSDTSPTDLPDSKQSRLLELLGSWGEVIVAFSGGVDSTYLAWAAHRALGGSARAILAVSPSLPEREREEAAALAEGIGIALEVVETNELEDERYSRNTGDRCYWCRQALVEALRPWARAQDAVVVYGAVPDDLGDDRPGMRAAEAGGIRAPLIEVGLSKEEVRELARRAGLPVWNKPAAACLASRVPVGHRVTREKLARIEAAEEVLREEGFSKLRVRDHGEIARIELAPEEISRLVDPELRRTLVEGIRRAGYERVTVDLAGYRPAGAGPLPVADVSSEGDAGA
jgi:uncharacterized protein